MNSSSALTTAVDYHRAWTSGDFAAATALLADDLAVEVPVNAYAGKADFAAALASFGGAATEVRLLAELSGRDDACLVYDMDVPGLGTLRVAEHFRVVDGRIRLIRQIHDTAAVRKAGFAPPL